MRASHASGLRQQCFYGPFFDHPPPVDLMTMTEAAFFSIITASLNSSRTIGLTMESVRYQSFPNFEHIVVDGGSTDGTVNTLREYEGTYNLKWMSEPDAGIADALNKGIRLVSGKYIIIIHADDRLLHPDVLGKIRNRLADESIDILSHPVLKESLTKGLSPYRPFKILFWHHFKNIIPHQGAFVHRRVFDKIGVFDPNIAIAFDYDFFYRALNDRVMVHFGSEAIAVMGGRGISSNQEFLRKRLKEEFEVHRKNEFHLPWRIAQILFKWFYYAYKVSRGKWTRQAPRQ
jgi:glycosyltransferase involved in cell wall biosynthesis